MVYAKFDYVIGNPPYSTQIVDQKLHREYYDKMGKGVKHSAIAFILKAIDNLKDGGSMIYVIPSNGMCLRDSVYFRKYILNNGSITDIYFTNTNLFGNAVIQGNLYIIKITKGIKKACEITTEYSNGLKFTTTIDYNEYSDGSVFPLILSESAHNGLRALLNYSDEKIIADDPNLSVMIKPGHNTMDKPTIKNDYFPGSRKVVSKINRGRKLEYGWTDGVDTSNTWKTVFSTICKIKEIFQNEGIPSVVVPPDTPVAAAYSYIKSDSKEHAEFISAWFKHPLFVISLAQLYDNSYLSDGNIGRLKIPNVSNLDDVWDYYKISDHDKKEIISLYDSIITAENKNRKIKK